MIDTNVSLFRWPFRRLIGDDPASLVARLRKKGVTQAWAASFEGLFCRDVAGVNARLGRSLPRARAEFSGTVWLCQSEAARLAGRRAPLP